jgi:hypothetical protein
MEQVSEIKTWDEEPTRNGRVLYYWWLPQLSHQTVSEGLQVWIQE